MLKRPLIYKNVNYEGDLPGLAGNIDFNIEYSRLLKLPY